MNDLTAPPEVGQAQKQADSIFAMVDAYEIDSPQMFEAAGSELQIIRSRFKEIEAKRVHLKEPFLEGGRRIDEFFKTPLDRLSEAGNLLKSRMLTFQTAEREAAERARREAEAAARAERERLEALRREAEAEERRIREEAVAVARAQAEAAAAVQRAAEQAAAEARQAGDEEAARAAEEAAAVQRVEAEAAAAVQRARDAEAAEAAALAAEQAAYEAELADVAPIALPTTVATKANGISTRQTWKAEVVDLHSLITAAAAGIAAGDPMLAAYLLPNQPGLNQMAKALKNQARIPGVRVYAEDGLAVRAA